MPLLLPLKVGLGGRKAVLSVVLCGNSPLRVDNIVCG